MSLLGRALPALPLILWKTPPALRMILEQEGVAFRELREPSPLAFRAGRFVLYDGKIINRRSLLPLVKPEHHLIDVDLLRDDEPVDPFEALLETSGRAVTWRLQGVEVVETVSRHDRARLRRRMLGKLRDVVVAADGIWARLAAYPYPYRSAFNLRVDLDECVPADYAAFAVARTPIEDATTHFVSTHAYGDEHQVLDDLRRLDVHSHGHYHVVYRGAEANRVNLRRAAETLVAAGIDGFGFAAPHGRWNLGLNAELEEIGCRFSSEFQVGYDDLPFFPWAGTRPSSVLQVPVHPICEGIFLDQQPDLPHLVGAHLAAVVRSKLDAGEPAFVYGHPERRLGRHPEILAAIVAELEDRPLTWLVGLGTFAEWWRWRLQREWSLTPTRNGTYQLAFEDWDARYPLGLEIVRDRHSAVIGVEKSAVLIQPGDLAYERRTPEYTLPPSTAVRPDWSVRGAIQRALDWETVTPVDDLPTDSLRSRVKRELRLWRERPRPAV